MTIDVLDMIVQTVGRYHVNIAILKTPRSGQTYFDLGLRSMLLKDEKAEMAADNIYKFCKEGVLYHILDRFESQYDIIPIPENGRAYGDYLVIGPYGNEVLDDYRLNALVQKLGLPVGMIPELRKYYCAVPLVLDQRPWEELILFFMHTLYEGRETKRHQMHLVDMDLSEVKEYDGRDAYLDAKIVEERYRLEGELLDAIAIGDTEQAQKVCGRFTTGLDRRYKDPNRDLRNLLIISNTIYRKAAERGFVHPVYIDRLSSGFAKKIEAVCTETQARRLAEEMVRKYCHLVKNYSLRGHSPVIQKAVNYIFLNLGNEISLTKIADEYSVNPSYLSALFKKEMGVNVSAFIIEQRMKRAILFKFHKSAYSEYCRTGRNNRLKLFQ